MTQTEPSENTWVHPPSRPARTSTPWGAAQSATTYGPGIIFYSTAGHGGLHLSKTANAKMPEALRNSDGWYEEDCDFMLVVAVFPHLFGSADKTLPEAIRSVKTWHPDQYMAWTGQHVSAEESPTVVDPARHAEWPERSLPAAADRKGLTAASTKAVVSVPGPSERKSASPVRKIQSSGGGTQPVFDFRESTAVDDVTVSARKRTPPMVSDAEHTALNDRWQEAFDSLRAAGLEADAVSPIAAEYRAASNALNHANRSRDFAIATGQSTVGGKGDAEPGLLGGSDNKEALDSGQPSVPHPKAAAPSGLSL